MKLTRDNIIRILKSAIKRETVEDEVGRVHRVKAEVSKAEVPQDELGRNRQEHWQSCNIIRSQ